MTGIKWEIDAARAAVTINFPTDPPLLMQIDLAEVEAMIAGLGNYRSVMEPAVAAGWAAGQACRSVADPAWRLETDAMTGDSLLHLRDPRFGWLHYLLPRGEAAALGAALSAQAEAGGEGLGPAN